MTPTCWSAYFLVVSCMCLLKFGLWSIKTPGSLRQHSQSVPPRFPWPSPLLWCHRKVRLLWFMVSWPGSFHGLREVGFLRYHVVASSTSALSADSKFLGVLPAAYSWWSSAYMDRLLFLTGSERTSRFEKCSRAAAQTMNLEGNPFWRLLLLANCEPKETNALNTHATWNDPCAVPTTTVCCSQLKTPILS